MFLTDFVDIFPSAASARPIPTSLRRISIFSCSMAFSRRSSRRASRTHLARGHVAAPRGSRSRRTRPMSSGRLTFIVAIANLFVPREIVLIGKTCQSAAHLNPIRPSTRCARFQVRHDRSSRPRSRPPPRRGPPRRRRRWPARGRPPRWEGVKAALITGTCAGMDGELAHEPVAARRCPRHSRRRSPSPRRG